MADWTGRGQWQLDPEVEQPPSCKRAADNALGNAAFDNEEDDPRWTGAPDAGLERRRVADRAIRLLGVREHGRTELIQKLVGRGATRALATDVVDDLAAQGLQSDERFTEQFVRGRLQRGYGSIWIRQALAQRGIAADIIEVHLDEPREVWVQRAIEARARKFGEEPPADRAEWQRQARYLVQRGFANEVVMKALGRFG